MQPKIIGRQIPKSLADQLPTAGRSALPINAILYRHAIQWVWAFASLDHEILGKAELNRRARERYQLIVEKCKSEADIQDIIAAWKKDGYLPKGAHTGKRTRKVRDS